MNALQLLRALGMDHPTDGDLAAASECIAQILRGAADFIEAADLDPPVHSARPRRDGWTPPGAPTVEPRQRYHNRRAAFLLRRMAPPSARGVVLWRP